MDTASAPIIAMNPLAELVMRYGPRAGDEGPVLFVREVLRAIPDPWQERVLRAYGRNERRISLRSCHGPGKTALLAWMIIHQLVCRYPQKTVATAPTSKQLFDALFNEVKLWMQHLPPKIGGLYEIKSDMVELRANPVGSFASFRTARAEQPEALQGIHAPWVLIIVDEASGVPQPIFEAAVGSMSGERATTILASNPVRTTGLFFDTHHKLKDQWFTDHISAFDSPRVSQEFINQVKRQYGEDSNAYRVRVLGEFPKSDQDTIIAYELVEAAANRDIAVNPKAAWVWGLDVARFGWCLTALVKRQGNVVMSCRTWSGLDTMQVVGVVKAEWDATIIGNRPLDICVDAIGIGAGVADRLKELALPVRAINVSETPAISERFTNQRTELYWRAREWFEQRTGKLPIEPPDTGDGPSLQRELTLLRYKIVDSTGRLRAETKDELKRRGFNSPDCADAFVLTFASLASTALGGGVRKTWSQPIHRSKSMREAATA